MQAIKTENKDGVEVFGFEVGKKVIEICKEKTTSMYFLQFTTGGELPGRLSGRFTTPQIAEKAIIQYAAERERADLKAELKEASKKTSTKKD